MKEKIIGRMPKGVDLNEYLCEIFLKEGLSSAWVSCIGALESVTLSFYKQNEKRYLERSFDFPSEMISAKGNLSLYKGKPFAHMHVTLADRDFEVFGGHLKNSRIFACEYFIVPCADTKNRVFDEDTGLNLWN